MDKDWRVLQFVTPKIKCGYGKEGHKDEFFITGEAIHATTTRNGTTFTVHELQQSSAGLVGKPLLKDHNNSVDSIVGRVVAAKWSQEKNATVFKAKITDPTAKANIENGNITSVSVGAMVDDVEEIEADGKTTYNLKGVQFLELSLVAIPADPSAGFGFEQAVTASLNAKKMINTSIYSQPVTASLTSIQPQTQIEEEKKPMAETTSNDKLADVLSQLTGALSAVSERMTAIETKMSEKPVVVAVAVAEDKKPETKGIVGAAAENKQSNEIYETKIVDGVLGIEMSNFNEMAKKYHSQRAE